MCELFPQHLLAFISTRDAFKQRMRSGRAAQRSALREDAIYYGLLCLRNKVQALKRYMPVLCAASERSQETFRRGKKEARHRWRRGTAGGGAQKHHSVFCFVFN